MLTWRADLDLPFMLCPAVARRSSPLSRQAASCSWENTSTSVAPTSVTPPGVSRMVTGAFRGDGGVEKGGSLPLSGSRRSLMSSRCSWGGQGGMAGWG